MFARSTALRTAAFQFSTSAPSRAAAQGGAQQKAASAVSDIAKKAQELGGPVVKRVEGLLGGKYYGPNSATCRFVISP